MSNSFSIFWSSSSIRRTQHDSSTSLNITSNIAPASATTYGCTKRPTRSSVKLKSGRLRPTTRASILRRRGEERSIPLRHLPHQLLWHLLDLLQDPPWIFLHQPLNRVMPSEVPGFLKCVIYWGHLLNRLLLHVREQAGHLLLLYPVEQAAVLL